MAVLLGRIVSGLTAKVRSIGNTWSIEQWRLVKVSERMKSLCLGASLAPPMEQAAFQIQDSEGFVCRFCLFLRSLCHVSVR